MSWSLMLSGGDLSYSGHGGLATVTGPQKVIQDLRNWLLTPRGVKDLHPDYGSILDGGMVQGIRVDSMIGSSMTRQALMDIEVELRRILQEYITQQAARLNNDLVKYGGRNTFANGELVQSVQSVDVTQAGDVVVARILVSTTGGQTLSLTQPVINA